MHQVWFTRALCDHGLRARWCFRLASTLDAVGHSVIRDQDSKGFRAPVPDFFWPESHTGRHGPRLRRANIRTRTPLRRSLRVITRTSPRASHVRFSTLSTWWPRIYDLTRISLQRLGAHSGLRAAHRQIRPFAACFPRMPPTHLVHPTGAVGLVNVTPSPLVWPEAAVVRNSQDAGSSSHRAWVRSARPGNFVVQEHDQLYFAINRADDAAA